MWKKFKNSPKPPARMPSGDVIPLHHFDDNSILRRIVVNFMLKFDDVLDPGKLRQALERLVTREDGWRKLTGRLRLNKKKRET
ncbi:Acetyltransferase BOT5 [Colletotrichum fructicola]|uniref:Acetyltransferase BOT5 n=1 Tax=Colletotrichum fructicola (strain Nara gc5) TaxID=1213859 RepID=A0A7J6J465_COLFN|nr:Acetyltransferase BOT5 [Colletotrichum fructicola]KAF4484631.1 Acetyltransferase BOT5 [Colletotrichum fructicola Nara gc5]KAF4884592.1 Acetyltransferase BOT5 [Colletotrichum fructicola]KAF4907079.1 Acetyltransferase BOT5 [Colletotrichum fructicola]KAF4936645.1 Acetyltransferase BOT5 [Colletotrichum fructicola]